MIRICAWHKKYFNKTKFLGITKPIFNLKVTHGMCRKCEKKWNREIDRTFKNKPIAVY